jgi:hypothetical protein
MVPGVAFEEAIAAGRDGTVGMTTPSLASLGIPLLIAGLVGDRSAAMAHTAHKQIATNQKGFIDTLLEPEFT